MALQYQALDSEGVGASTAGRLYRSPPEAPPPRIARLQHKVAASRLPRSLQYLLARALSAASRLDPSFQISDNIAKFRAHRMTRNEKIKYSIMGGFALFSLFIMEVPSFPLKLGIPLAYLLTILIPATSQFFLPAAPIFTWLIFFYSSKFIPASSRPHIWVSLLPTLESIWYGASISDILTRFGHPALDIFAWIPYGVVHFAGPFFVAAALFVFGPPGAVKVFASAFGFMNLVGVFIQITFPCAPPWYELREGLTPANYGMKGSPAGLARIDALFGGHGYTLTFSNAPVPFGAFPSLHAGSATMEALFCSYFFPLAVRLWGESSISHHRSSVNGGSSSHSIAKPGSSRRGVRLDMRIVYWLYAAWLYWCTMYLMHHYLIDLVAGGCLATMCFYFFLTDEMREAMELHYRYRPSSPSPASAAPSPLRPASAFGTRRNRFRQETSETESHALPTRGTRGLGIGSSSLRNGGVGGAPGPRAEDFVLEDDDEEETSDSESGSYESGEEDHEAGDAGVYEPNIPSISVSDSDREIVETEAGTGAHESATGSDGTRSKRREVIFSAADEMAGDQAQEQRQQAGTSAKPVMPTLSRFQSASRAA